MITIYSFLRPIVPKKIDREIMQMAKSSPVMLSNGKRLSSAKIKRRGYVLWLDDLSELIEVNDKLAEAKDDLKDDYDLICEEYDLRKQRGSHTLSVTGYMTGSAVKRQVR